MREIIKNQTRNIHNYLENLPIMSQIINQKITPQNYINYLNQIKHIYNVIETNNCYKSLNIDIFIYQKCDNDITQIEKLYNIKRSVVYPITNIYCSYLSDIKDPDIMMAHCYVRYMADLSGGFIIKKKLPQEWSTTLYDINDLKYKKAIIEYINNKIMNQQIFISEVHHSFMAYSSILSICS